MNVTKYYQNTKAKHD